MAKEYFKKDRALLNIYKKCFSRHSTDEQLKSEIISTVIRSKEVEMYTELITDAERREDNTNERSNPEANEAYTSLVSRVAALEGDVKDLKRSADENKKGIRKVGMEMVKLNTRVQASCPL